MKAQTPKYFNNKLGIGILLLPLAFLYWLVSFIKKRFTKEYRSKARVICVGNITLGGVGKTPIVVKIVETLIKNNVKVGILSRGYKGKLSSNKPIIVDITKHSALDVGDEVYMMAQKFKNIPVCICKNRKNGAKLLENKVDIIVMDDGLQNYTLKKDVCVVVFDGKDTIGNNFIFPAGPLRESLKSGMKKANAVIITRKKNPCFEKNLQKYMKPIFHTETILKKLPFKNGDKVIAFAGIGKPEKFYESLKNIGLNIVQHFEFDDHYQYNWWDMQIMKDLCKKNLPIITTMKDYVKIPQEYKKDITPVDIDLKIEKEFFEFLRK